MPKDLVKDAVTVRKSLLGYMGDKQMSFPETLAQNILMKGLDKPKVRDEVRGEGGGPSVGNRGQNRVRSIFFLHIVAISWADTECSMHIYRGVPWVKKKGSVEVEKSVVEVSAEPFDDERYTPYHRYYDTRIPILVRTERAEAMTSEVGTLRGGVVRGLGFVLA